MFVFGVLFVVVCFVVVVVVCFVVVVVVVVVVCFVVVVVVFFSEGTESSRVPSVLRQGKHVYLAHTP